MRDSPTHALRRGRLGGWLTAGVVGAVVLAAQVGVIAVTAQDALSTYAACMRDNGIEVTDPVFDAAGKMIGGLEFEGGKDAQGDESLTANEACKSLDAFEPVPKEEEAKADWCDNSGDPGFRSLVQGGASRDYLLYVPDALDSDAAAPLIVSFHGFGGCATVFAREVGEAHGLHQLADEQGFVVAYPQGLERAKGGAEWDPGDDGGGDITTNDLVFTEQLVQEISEAHPIDRSRVYAAGYSNGGMMAYGLACSRSGLIAAAGVMSGVMLSDDCDQGRPTSVIHFHGADDDVLPLQGNRDFQSAASTVDFWLEQNGIHRDSLRSDELRGGDVLRESYEGGAQDTSVALYTIRSEYEKGGGHVWFSEEIEGQTPNEILWDFLSQERRQD